MPAPSDRARVRKHSVIVAGHATSVTLEQAFWEALGTIADARGVSINQIVTEVDEQRTGPLSSALRVFILDAVRETGT